MLTVSAQAQTSTPEEQIAAAVKPAPPELQESATVLGYDESGELVPAPRKRWRTCLPGRRPPRMTAFTWPATTARWSPLWPAGVNLRNEGQVARRDHGGARSRSGSRHFEDATAACRALFAFNRTGRQLLTRKPAKSAGPTRSASCTSLMPPPEETGLPTNAPPGQPWIMDSGKPWAHIMLIPARPGKSGRVVLPRLMNGRDVRARSDGKTIGPETERRLNAAGLFTEADLQGRRGGAGLQDGKAPALVSQHSPALRARRGPAGRPSECAVA